MKLAVKTLEGKDAGEVTLDASVFGITEIRKDVLHQVVNYQLAARRAGTHKVKERGEIRGTGKKPWAQKGTGRARAGDLKRPQDRGGGVAHGPKTRGHGFSLNKKVRALALRHALSSKAAEGKLIILDEAKAATHKTKDMAAALKGLEVDSAVIVAGAEVDTNFARGCANIPRVDVLPAQGANVYDILRRERLVLTRDAVDALTERLAS